MLQPPRPKSVERRKRKKVERRHVSIGNDADLDKFIEERERRPTNAVLNSERDHGLRSDPAPRDDDVLTLAARTFVDALASERVELDRENAQLKSPHGDRVAELMHYSAASSELARSAIAELRLIWSDSPENTAELEGWVCSLQTALSRAEV